MNAIAQLSRYWKANAEESRRQHEENKCWTRQMMRAQRRGRSVLPYFLGLSPEDFHWITDDRRLRFHDELFRRRSDEAIQVSDVRQQLLDLREDEWNELVELLSRHRCGLDDSEFLLAKIVAAGCMGGSHLWRDLGLSSRDQLSSLLQVNFPRLANANTQNMKWKKYFYKQLCEQGGGYVCRAPSCDTCAAYRDCFGPEE
ncbi:MAG: nitrogen fixation protein NifQ [Pseudomonas sp.]|uniref:nitrogen fixation protein NifQ n=1 Tax=Thalassolituus oleivorans TaxID=187493 RepID=UPI001A363915|nr:nitrogen fixation protein NifQ [Thalassolituus oleivorans]MBL4832589.1 nitrogen fixation protein NifQ [Pseudomonas sp.]|tara:strand:- start:12116 stop:12715 length:600 start_codon:yes stop_codon:yes gene_type:complete